MDLFIVVKTPGARAQVLPAPPVIDIPYIKVRVGGYVARLLTHDFLSEPLAGACVSIDEDRVAKQLDANLKFEFDLVRGPVLVTLSEDGVKHSGLPLAHAEGVAKALDRYSVGPKRSSRPSFLGPDDIDWKRIG